MVGSELELDAFGGLLPGGHADTGVVDEDVQSGGEGFDLGGGLADGLLGGEVEEDDFHACGGVFGVDLGGDFLDTGERAGGEDEQGGGLRGDVCCCCLAYALGAYPCDENCEDWMSRYVLVKVV